MHLDLLYSDNSLNPEFAIDLESQFSSTVNATSPISNHTLSSAENTDTQTLNAGAQVLERATN